MKYCTKCGNQLKENSKFCSKCGSPTKLELLSREEERKKEKEEKKDKTLLYLGAGLIILSSIIFAFSNWNNMSNIFKLIFLFLEMIIFLSISIFSKRLDENMPYKVSWFIGVLFVPIIFILIAEYEMFGLSNDGNAINVYLAISSLISGLVFYFSYKYIKSNLMLYLGFASIYSMILFILYAFGLENIYGMNLTFIIFCIINLIITILANKSKNDYTILLNKFIKFVLIVITILLSQYVSVAYNEYINIILSVLSCIIHVITILLFMKLNNIKGLSYAFPYVIYFLLFMTLNNYFYTNINIYVFFSIIAAIALYLIFSLYDNKIVQTTSFVLMIVYIISILLTENISEKAFLVLSILLLISNIFIYKIIDENIEKKTCTILLPITLFMSVSSIIRLFTNLEYSIIYMIVSVLYFSIYTIINYKLNNKTFCFIFKCFSYILLALASILILSDGTNILLFVINEVLWIYYLLFEIFSKKMISKNIILLIAVILNLLIASARFNISLYYSLLFISLIFTLIDIVLFKFKLKGENVCFYISLVSIILATLFNFDGYIVLSVCVNVLIYCSIYYILSKKNISFIIKYIYTLVGFCLISRLFNYFIDQSVIANIFILLAYIIIIISMFLLQTDTDNKVLSYTPVIIFPYSFLASNVDILREFKEELIVLLIVSLIILFMEKVFNLKNEKDRTLLEIIFISLVHITALFTNVIFNCIIAVFYIFFGIFKKKDSFIILGIILLLLSIFINLFKIVDNLSIIYILLSIGILLIAYVFITSAKKNNK